MNIADGDMFTYGKFWPVLAKQYSIECGIPEMDESKFQTVQMPIAPPPRGFGPAGKVKIGWSSEEWEKNPRLWRREKRSRRDGITKPKDPFSGQNVKDVFGLLDGELLGGCPGA